MRKTGKRVFWGIVIVLGAILLLIDGLKIINWSGYGLTPFKLFVAVLSSGWFLYELINLKIHLIFIPIAIFFVSIESTLAYYLGIEGGNIISNWVVYIVALLLTIGFKMLLPRRSNKYMDEIDEIGKLSSSTLYFDGGDLSDAQIKNVAGTVNVYISNKDAYSGDGIIEISDFAGKVTLHLPKEWLIKTNVRNHIGKVKIPRQNERSYEKTLTLELRNVAGNIKVILE